MDPRFWKKPWSRLHEGKAFEVETPELYLKLTTRCMEQVNRLCSTRESPLPKFNQEQCTYLAHKLQLAIQSANSIIKDVNREFLSLTQPKEMEQPLEIFRLLNSMGVEVETLIQNCCKEAWIQSAIMFTNTLEHVATICWNLEFCTNIFSTRQLERTTTLMWFDATRIRKVVKEKADLDGMKLIMDLRNVIDSNVSSNVDSQLATFLLGRLESATLPPDIRSKRSKERVLPFMNTSLQQMPDCLGKGAFAIVRKATWFGVEVARKTFYVPTSVDFLREVSILDGLNHPNIVSLLWSMTDGKRCHLVMELMDGDLFNLMQQRMEENGNQGCPFSIPEALDLIFQIGEGMLYLHEKRIVHRDLKSHNILIRCGKMGKGNMKYLHVKVADFGLSKTKERSATYSDMSLNVGTTRWMAPEVMRVATIRSDDVNVEKEALLNHPFKIDIYSFAMVCYEILTGEVPFSSLSHSEVKKAVLSGDRPSLPSECPYRLRTLIEACWSVEASTRPSFNDICEELRDLKYSSLQIYWKATISRCPLEDIATIDKLVAKLSSPIVEAQQRAICDFHLLAEKSIDHRMYIKAQEAMPLLVLFSYSRDRKTREHAITALQALFVDDKEGLNSTKSLEDLSLRWIPSFNSSFYGKHYLGSAVGPIVEVLKSGRMKTRENAAEALMKISFDLGFNVGEKIRNSGGFPALVTLLQDGTTEGKEYAAILLFRTFRSQNDYASAIQVGIVPPLMNLIAQQSRTILDDGNIVDDAFSILTTLVMVPEGLIAIAEVRPTPILVKFIGSESRWNKDRAAAILRRLCLHDPRFVKEAKESNVIECLAVLAQGRSVHISFYTSEVRALVKLLQEPKVDDLQLQ